MPLWHWVHSSFYACFAIKCDEVPYQPSKSTTCDLQPQGASPPFTGFKTFRFKDLSSAGLLWITINRASAHQCLTSSRRALVNCHAVYPDEAKLTQSGAFPSCSLIKTLRKGPQINCVYETNMSLPVSPTPMQSLFFPLHAFQRHKVYKLSYSSSPPHLLLHQQWWSRIKMNLTTLKVSLHGLWLK